MPSSYNEIKKQIDIYSQQLQKLREANARHDINASSSILLEIEDIKTKIAELQGKLKNASDHSLTSEDVNQPMVPKPSDAYLTQRLSQLKQHIIYHLTMLKDFEDRVRREDNPRRLFAIEEEIEREKMSLKQYREEANELEALLLQSNMADYDTVQGNLDLNTISQKLDDLQEKIKNLEPLLEINEQPPTLSQIEAIITYAERLLSQSQALDLPSISHPLRTIKNLTLSDLYIPLRLDMKVEVEDQPYHHMEEDDESIANESRSNMEARLQTSSLEEIKRQQTIGQLLDEHPRICILGKPGSGKSTLVQWLVQSLLFRFLNQDGISDYEALPTQSLLPIVIRCRQLPRESTTWDLLRLIKHTLRKHGIYFEKLLEEMLAMELKDQFEAGKALLIIDGMDEIDGVWREKFCDNLKDIIRSFGQGKILMTLRSLGYEAVQSLLSNWFDYAEMNNLTQSDKETFVDRWCSTTVPHEQLRDKLKTNLFKAISDKNLQRLTEIPLTLTALILVAETQEGLLPEKHGEIYNEFIDILLKQNAPQHAKVSWDEAIPQLEYLAYAMCNEGILEINRNKIEELLIEMRHAFPYGRYIKKERLPHEFLSTLLEQTTLLRKIGFVKNGRYQVPTYQFNHRFIQEYFAGRSLIEGYVMENGNPISTATRIAMLVAKTDDVKIEITDWKHIVETVVIDEWHEPLKHCIEATDDVKNILLAILTVPEGEDPLKMARPRAVMAAYCLAEVKRNNSQLDPLARQVISSLIDQIKEYDAFDDTPKTSLDKAVVALRTSSWGDLLRKMLLTRLISPFLSPMALQPVALVYLMANTPLLPEDDFEIWEKWLIGLVDNLQHQEEREVVRAALLIMNEAYKGKGRVNFEYGIHTSLLNRLEGSPAVVSAVTWALRWIFFHFKKNHYINWQPQPEQLRILTRYLENLQSDKLVVRNILLMLPDILGTQPLQQWAIAVGKVVRQEFPQTRHEFVTSELVEVIVQWLNDTEEKVRIPAALTLGRLGIIDSRAMNGLLEVIDKEQIYEKEREEATQYLGCLDGQAVIRQLVDRLVMDNPKSRISARYALASIGSETVVSAVLERFPFSNLKTKKELALVLEMVGNSQAIAILKKWEQDKEFGKIVQGLNERLNGKVSESNLRLFFAPNLDDYLVVLRATGRTSSGEPAFVYISSLFDRTINIIEGLREDKPVNPVKNDGAILAISTGEPDATVKTKMQRDYRFSDSQIKFEKGSSRENKKPFTAQSTHSNQPNKDQKPNEQVERGFLLDTIENIRVGSGYMKAPVNKLNVMVFSEIASQINSGLYNGDQSKNELIVVDGMGRPIQFDEL